MMDKRKRLFEVIESADVGDTLSRVYDIFMIIVIVISLYPMTIKVPTPQIILLEQIVAVIFIIDYLLRWFTADFKVQKGKKSFLLYPFTFMAIADFISIIPVIATISNSFRILRSIRLFRALRVVRAARFFRYSKNIDVIVKVLVKQKDSLTAVGFLVLGYIFLSAMLVFSVEPTTFPKFFDALYWACISLTTIGYGDIYTISTIGRIISMVSALVGVAIVALPAGIITAGFMEEFQEEEELEKEARHNEELAENAEKKE